MNKFRFLSLCLLLNLFLFGCGGPQIKYGSLDLVEVEGTVTLDGTPLANALVTFRAEDHTTSSGQTDATGNYRLMLNSEKSGVTPGEKTVVITTNYGEGPSEGESVKADKIPKKYNEKSTLKVLVEKKGKQRHDFTLTTK